jgi:DNA mismatch repair protein MutS
MALVTEYFDLTIQYSKKYGEKTIVLMQVGAFFEVYGCYNREKDATFGSQIVEFSTICDLNIADKKMSLGGNDTVVMAGFSHFMIDKYVKKLQGAGYTIVVYVQNETSSKITRQLSCIYSPGTYFSPESTFQITNSIMCVWLNTCVLYGKKNIYIGIANIDIFTGKSNIFEYSEVYNELCPTVFDSLERFVSIYNPNETILIGNVREKDFDQIINFTNIQSKSIHRICLLEEEGEVETS